MAFLGVRRCPQWTNCIPLELILDLRSPVESIGLFDQRSWQSWDSLLLLHRSTAISSNLAFVSEELWCLRIETRAVVVTGDFEHSAWLFAGMLATF